MKTTLFVLFILLTACATIEPLHTPSGKPDITIPNVTKKKVTDRLINQMLEKGYSIKNATDYTIVFIKPMDKFGEQLLLGSQYDSTPENRITANIVESGTGIRILLNNQAITNPGSGFERVTDLNTGNYGMNWQNFLTYLKYYFY